MSCRSAAVNNHSDRDDYTKPESVSYDEKVQRCIHKLLMCHLRNSVYKIILKSYKTWILHEVNRKTGFTLQPEELMCLCSVVTSPA